MTTKRSYEDQLSMMSDHLCSMNETLTKQREEIDTLKMTSKVSWQCWHRALAAVGVWGSHLVFLQYCPGTNHLTSVIFTWKENSKLASSSFSDEKLLAKYTRGKEEALHVTASHEVLKLYPLMADHTIFLFQCGENGTICKSSWWGWVVMIKFWVEVSLLHCFWLQHTLSLAAGLFLCFISIF